MWKEIDSGQEVFLVSSELINDRWRILLTNLVELWGEDTSREQVVDKCQRLNPLLSIEDVNIDEIVTGIFSKIPQLAVEVTKSKIKLETTVEGGVFKFEIDLVKQSSQELWREITMPLCLCVGELRRQKEMLIKEIKRKDEEIMEYRANGAELIRKHIQTKLFEEDSIKGDSLVDSPKGCLNIFNSVIADNEVCRAKNTMIKKENLFYNTSQSSVISNDALSESNHIKTEETKRRKVDVQTKTIVEPEVEVQEMAMSAFHFMDWPSDINPSTPSAKRKRGRCSFCPRSCDLKTTATCSKCPSFVCSNHKRVFCIKCVSVPSTTR